MIVLPTCTSAFPLSGATLLLQDTFTGTNNDALTSHTMNVGSGWTSVGVNSFQIQSNKAERTGSVSGADKVHADAGQADVMLTVDATAASGSTLIIEVILRYVNTTNYWYYYALNSLGTSLNEVTANVDTQRATGSLTLVDGQTYAMRVDCNGDTITGYIDGVQKGTYASATSHNTATKFGIAAESSTASYDPKYDNFEVWTL